MAASLFIVPGLGDSGPGHWQSRLEAARPGTQRLRRAPWHAPDLEMWVAALSAELSTARGVVIVAHSFGCLAAAKLLQRSPRDVRAALFVAPANPARFGLQSQFRAGTLDVPSVLVASDNDPWCPADESRRLALQWGSQFLSLGRAGHINVDSGHGRWAFGERLADTLARTYGPSRRRQARPSAAHGVATSP